MDTQIDKGIKPGDGIWPRHHFRGYEELNEEFASIRTKHRCTSDLERVYPHWGKFERGPCYNAVQGLGVFFFSKFKLFKTSLQNI